MLNRASLCDGDGFSSSLQHSYFSFHDASPSSLPCLFFSSPLLITGITAKFCCTVFFSLFVRRLSSVCLRRSLPTENTSSLHIHTPTLFLVVFPPPLLFPVVSRSNIIVVLFRKERANTHTRYLKKKANKSNNNKGDYILFFLVFSIHCTPGRCYCQHSTLTTHPPIRTHRKASRFLFARGN
jgi:hypothetical protein